MTASLTTKTTFELAQAIVRKTRAALPVTHDVKLVIQALVERGIRHGMDRERDSVGAALHDWKAKYNRESAEEGAAGNHDMALHLRSKADAIGELIASITPANSPKHSAASSKADGITKS